MKLFLKKMNSRRTSFLIFSLAVILCVLLGPVFGADGEDQLEKTNGIVKSDHGKANTSATTGPATSKTTTTSKGASPAPDFKPTTPKPDLETTSKAVTTTNVSITTNTTVNRSDTTPTDFGGESLVTSRLLFVVSTASPFVSAALWNRATC